MSLGGSRPIHGPSCGSALTNSKAFVERPKRSRPVHSLLVKKLPILIDLDEEVSVGMCNIEQGVHLSCVFDLIAQIRRSGSLTMLVQQLAFVRGVTSTQLFYLSKSKSNSSQNYSSKSKSTDSKKLLK